MRYLDEVAIALEEIWLDARFAKKVRAAELEDSLYQHYKLVLGLVISRIEDRVGLGKVPPWTEEELALKVGAPIPMVERLSWGNEKTPAEYSRTWFNPQRARYVARQT